MAAAITGAQTKLAFKIATTFGTAVATTKLFAVENFNQTVNVAELSSSPIGINFNMLEDKEIGRKDPRLDWTMKLGYNNNAAFFVAQMMGTAGAPTEVTGGQADWKHTITFNDTLNGKYLTMAELDTDSTTLEWPSVAITDLTFETGSPPNYVMASFSAIADQRVSGSATNTSAVVTALTAPTMDEAVVTEADSFLINVQTGAGLAGGDKLNITNYSLKLSRPQESIPEIKGAAGNSAPIASDLFSGTLTIQLKSLIDHTYITAWEAGTYYKSKFTFDGAQIGTGTNASWVLYVPRMRLINTPEYNLSSTGLNGPTLTFEILKASANPTGMSSTYPYFETTNGIAVSLLA